MEDVLLWGGAIAGALLGVYATFRTFVKTMAARPQVDKFDELDETLTEKVDPIVGQVGDLVSRKSADK